ncbi:TetR family transcriptional regulator [Amycolatopsis sp. NPDC051903]|uniref:TetR family transcriptional regulator n=1 Tax=Amycolatopsis sp. NPDC051903 TaxID=3363936 RepID=UPI0037BB4AE0
MDASARERLIEGTRELLWDRGYLGTSPTAILRRSGVGQGSMYHHFQGKPDLALAAEQRSAEIMKAQSEGVLKGPGTALERIAGYLLLDREVLRGCAVGRLAGDPEIIEREELRQPVRDALDQVRVLLAEVIEQAQQDGELDAALRPSDLAATLSAVLQGGYVLARAEQSCEPFDRAVQGALGLLRAHSADPESIPAR